MKAFATALLLVSCAMGHAQTPAQATAHAPDGGVVEKLQSIIILPLTNSPFSATVTTDWTKILPDGTTATMKNHRTIARDSSGRIFEERRAFTPTGDKQPTRIQNLQYMDPNRHEVYDCNPEQKVCYVSTYRRQALVKMPEGIGGLQACGCGSPAGMSAKQEALGEKSIEDVQVTGSREVTTIAEGTIGNSKPEPIVKEFWYSPRLGINLVVKRFDPRSGIQDFAVSGISLSEPDPKTFLPPADYEIVRAPRRGGM